VVRFEKRGFAELPRCSTADERRVLGGLADHGEGAEVLANGSMEASGASQEQRTMRRPDRAAGGITAPADR
jgi:hypothetical protein